MNRFDYFSDIEDTFVRLRGKHLMLDPMDWELIEAWKIAGVPLHVVLRTIEEAFERQRAKDKGVIRTLRFIKDAVEEAFEQWKSMRVGAHEPAEDGRDPFPKEKVITYLQDAAHALVTKAKVPEGCEDTFAEALDALGQLEVEFAENGNARTLEEELTKIERNLYVAIESGATPEQIAEARAAAEALFGPYKNNMLPQVYQQQIDTALKNNLRKAFGVPRLSLFHMK